MVGCHVREQWRQTREVTNGTISGGLQGMLLSHIQNHLGFSMSFTPIPGVNGSSHWGRTFSVIRDGLFDLSPSSWTVSHARHALVDFTFPTVTVTVGFGIRTPDAETDTTAFLRPFDESAYAGVVLLLVLLATAAWLLDNRSRLLASLREFTVWTEKVKGYFLLTGAGELHVKGQRAALLSLLDEDWHRVIRFGLDLTEDATPDTVMNAMEGHLRKQRNVLVDRREFYGRVQEPGERFDEFL
ncbi:hypothetical protein FJT64_011716 [Amphibalanus amphitrite]|uniref:Uncharacterized protein n=1 Tax=Amphibalanus amphitrite TaxID=1232801 RepID=A0A6A4VAB3_AMPAM|nr:hypothetical protein FJT64_011716 [Amphibalanus amphitrite]